MVLIDLCLNNWVFFFYFLHLHKNVSAKQNKIYNYSCNQSLQKYNTFNEKCIDGFLLSFLYMYLSTSLSYRFVNTTGI